MADENMLFATEDQMDASNEQVVEVQTDKYLIFASDDLLYGIDADQVVEIITDHTITYLPRVPHYVRGIINLRGQLIPILDIRMRLGKMPGDKYCVVVVNVGGDQIGILVDGVEKMVDVPRESILPMPTQNSEKMISGMCSLGDGGTMLVLDCELLVHD